jgi:hypothetical protein
MQMDMSKIAEKHGFELLESQELAEISGIAYTMKHSLSHAKLLFLQNDDSNKTFSITFKTPAADNTGVFHILEHSVLCGSKKFPVKEPFVDLLKGSMQTFLNAMTFPDKTMYPVASTNDADLKNLADVYMDAVFNPRIYSSRNIFEQEGWHLEVAHSEPEDAEDIEGVDESSAEMADDINKPSLFYNGVVYNEMKGALSDSDSVLYDALSSAMFPDTTYVYESGGIPANIPDLTYEAFLDTHARHYRPDNSYIILYGDIDIDDFLEFLDTAYLTPLACRNDSPRNVNEIGFQSPHRTFGAKVAMQTTPEQASYALGLYAGAATDRKRIFCVDILLDALAGSNEAPLKRAVLDAKLADDFRVALSDSLAQPFVMLELKGIQSGSDVPEKFRGIIKDCAQSLVDGGLNHSLIEASLAHSEFVLREHDFGVADGVIYAMSVMSGWLYDDAHALSYLKYEDAIEFASSALKEGYFEQLIRELFIDNDFCADVELVPQSEPTVEAAASAEVLIKLADELNEDEIAAIEADCLALKTAQATPDAPEAVATLPRLSPKDIDKAPHAPAVHLFDEGSYTTLVHDIDTHGIAYFYRYFDLDCLDFEDIPYAGILTMLLGRLSTRTYTAEDLDCVVQLYLGNLDFYIEVHELAEDPTCVLPKFCVSTSALSVNAAHVATLVNDVLLTTDFFDTDRIYDILVQKRVAMEQFFATSGNAAALSRLASYYSYAGVLREKAAGIEFYQFLRNLLDNFDSRKAELSQKLKHIATTLFNDDSMMLSFAGPAAALEAFEAAGGALGVSATNQCGNLVIPEPTDKHEAFVVPCDISFAAMGADRRTFPSPYSGAWLVLSRVLSYDYLWNTVRVQGGAYGVSFKTSRAGSSYFASYRDPNLDATLTRFKEAGAWVADFNPDQDVMDGYIVSSVAGIDTPVKPRAMLRRQDSMYFTNFTQEARDALRAQVIATTAEDVRALAPALDALASQDHLCCIGNADIISKSKCGFDVVDLYDAKADYQI